MRIVTRIFAIVFSLSLCQISTAQNPAVSIEDFGFLQGFWSGTGFGGQSEEVWMPPVDGRMFGIFKQSENNSLVFTEYMEIVESDGGFVLRLKHFNPDFSGWEEKNDYVTFKLSSVSPNKAVFGSLSYEIVAPNALQIKLRMRNDDGSTVTEEFDLNRTAL